MYFFHKARSARSAWLNFQFLAGSSIRARKRFRCSDLEKVQEEFHHARAIAAQMFFQVGDGAQAVFPEFIIKPGLRGQVLALQDLGMHADDQHFFVVGAVKARPIQPRSGRLWRLRAPGENHGRVPPRWVA